MVIARVISVCDVDRDSSGYFQRFAKVQQIRRVQVRIREHGHVTAPPTVVPRVLSHLGPSLELLRPLGRSPR